MSAGLPDAGGIRDAVEAWISALPDNEFRLLVARTRPPDEQLVDRDVR